MCNIPAMPNGASANPGKKQKPNDGFIGASLDNLPAIGQRKLGLASTVQFGSLASTILGPPKDISRQAQ